MWSAHEVDGRIAAKNAVKIRAALRNSIDARRVFENYLTTQPAVSVNEGQDRARARAWALLNLRINNEALKQALLRLYAEAWVTGDLVAQQEIQIAQSEQSKSADITKAEDKVMIIDWDTWQPGDAASAMLLDPPKAFQDLVSRSGNLITGLDKTGYELIGTALADSIRLGLSPSRAAKRINETIGNPARALTIAVTESSRVMNASAMNRYKASGIKQHKWMPVLAVAGGGVACERCAQNTGQVVEIGASFNSGNTQPPAHPHCRCNLQPVLPDYSELFDKDGNYVAPPVNQNGVTDIAPKPIYREAADRKELDQISIYQLKDRNFVDYVKGPIGTSSYSDNAAPAFKALRAYKGSGYIETNSYLRRGELRKEGNLPIVKDYIERIDEVMSIAPPLKEDILSFRGLKGDYIDEIFDGLGVGDIWIDKGFSSTSLNSKFPKQWVGLRETDAWVVTIQNPKGTKGIMLDGLINESSGLEAEWLLPRNSKFEIIEIDRTTRNMTVRVVI